MCPARAMTRGAARQPNSMPPKYADPISPTESGGKPETVALSGISVFDNPFPAIRMYTAASSAETWA